MRELENSAKVRAMVLAKRRLLEIFYETSFKSSEEPVFRLASGVLSKYYIDCKQALSDPEARALIGDLIFELTKAESFDSVGGLELGAYPIATSVSDKIFRERHNSVRAFVIRKEQKTHGVTDLVAGHVERGDKTLIVDDVVTTGSSTIKAIRGARQAGLSVSRVIVLVDREEGDGRKNIEAEGVKFDALFTLGELRELSNESAKQGNAEACHGGALRSQFVGAIVAG
ncbi:MAG: orotate phosphoribosyltransferase [Candidatus Korobacteraceae bacterium]